MEDQEHKTPTAVDVRRTKFDQTTITATATIDAERSARVEKSERLRAAREARDAELET